MAPVCKAPSRERQTRAGGASAVYCLLTAPTSNVTRKPRMETPQENSEGEGEWLHVRVRYRKTDVPVRISLRALEEHFGALDGQHTPIFLLREQQAIDLSCGARQDETWRALHR